MDASPRIGVGRWLAAIAVLMPMTACAAPPAPSASPVATLVATPTATLAATPTTAPANTSATWTPPPLADVLGRVRGSVIGPDERYPEYSIRVPATWGSGRSGQFIVKRVEGILGVSVWDVHRVPSDPCRWQDSLVQVGSSVEDLVTALVAQRSRAATTPVDVTVAGHAGRYLEWSVPDDVVVNGDADFKGCDRWYDNDHRDFVSWLTADDGERYQQVAGQVDRLWVLDVDGQRLVVDATYSPDTTAQDRQE